MIYRRIAPTHLTACAAIAITACSGGAPRPSYVPPAPMRVAAEAPNVANDTGNILIADQWNNRVVEVDAQHRIVWQFGDGSSIAGPHSVVGVNDAERYGKLTLIAGTGLPAGTIPACSKKPCQDNRVFVVDQTGKIVWQYGKTGVPGSKAGYLNAPVSAMHLPNGGVLVTDQGNQRVIEISASKRITWQYGTTGKSGAGAGELNNPNSAQLLSNGNVLIADENNNRVLEVTPAGKIAWEYGSPKDTKKLDGAAYASRLSNGNTLITDSLNSRVVEVTPSGRVAWSYATNKQHGSISAPQPSHAVRLKNGDTLVSNQIDDEIVEVTPAGKIAFQQGKVAKPGAKFDELNWPYDAKVVGDYTGLTTP
ncbi:MAG: PQQ-binding-like beta-propeller repeat protein [Candidatus Eremiobacteraeota bacterium]|nr:PQQ-binding-like beta-propeller repeat protein [Candidatus Eremiobacteraeota bacterium]